MERLSGEEARGSADVASESSKRVEGPTLVPFVIRQLLTADYDDDQSKFSIGDRQLAEVTLVARVFPGKDAPTPSCRTYYLDDGTGIIAAKMWFDAVGPSGDMIRTLDPFLADPQKRQYVRAFGHLRSIDRQRMVVIFRFSFVEDYNELTHHLLSVMVYHHIKAVEASVAHPTAPPTLPPQGPAAPFPQPTTMPRHIPPSNTPTPQGPTQSLKHPPSPFVGPNVLPAYPYAPYPPQSTPSWPPPAPQNPTTPFAPQHLAAPPQPALGSALPQRHGPPSPLQSLMPVPGGSFPSIAPATPQHLPPVELQVYQFLQQYGATDLGLSRQHIQGAVASSGVSPPQVESALASLVNRGLIVKTVDDNHFSPLRLQAPY